MEIVMGLIFMFAAFFSGNTDYWIAFALCVVAANLDCINTNIKKH